MSTWSSSRYKRLFDVTLVLVSAPIVLPLLAVIAVLVAAFDGSPVFFRQVRIGRNGKSFFIIKFRTMKSALRQRKNVTASIAKSEVTPFGCFLRQFKLDELPQVLNVLAGDMSLVGPRPKIPEQQVDTFSCRPGITGKATLAFAREERLLAAIPDDQLTRYYRETILPAKSQLDDDYMSNASLLSDLHILFSTVTGRWGNAAEYAMAVDAEPERSIAPSLAGVGQIIDSATAAKSQ